MRTVRSISHSILYFQITSNLFWSSTHLIAFLEPKGGPINGFHKELIY
jgi:hypothetical protein